MNNKYRFLAKNVGLLTISRFGTSILTFFLVPLYTSILSTEDYGLYELINTTVSLLIPILTINIADAVFRFSIDNKKDWKNVFSTGIRYLLIGTFIVIALLGINYTFDLYQPFKTYSLYILLLFIGAAFSSVMELFTRGQEKIKELSISGVLRTATMIVLNIVLLMVFRMGIDGYFIAMILSYFVPTIYLAIVCDSSLYITLYPDNQIRKDMAAYSTPMVANAVGWWINNVSDRYVVTLLCGVAVNGIYSVAYKIPSILTVFQNIFAQAWTLSAVKDFDEDDKSGFFCKVYNLYNLMNVLLCSILIAITKIIAFLLFRNDFYEAWRYVPFLLISVVFGSLSGYFGSIFSAVKASKLYAQSTVIGAVVNTFLNFILIYFIGPLGAAVATATSYFVVFLIRLKSTKSIIDLGLNLKRDFFAYAVLVIQSIAIIAMENSTIIQACALIALIVLFAPETRGLIDKVKSVRQ